MKRNNWVCRKWPEFYATEASRPSAATKWKLSFLLQASIACSHEAEKSAIVGSHGSFQCHLSEARPGTVETCDYSAGQRGKRQHKAIWKFFLYNHALKP
jgi:hypothetical protein